MKNLELRKKYDTLVATRDELGLAVFNSFEIIFSGKDDSREDIMLELERRINNWITEENVDTFKCRLVAELKAGRLQKGGFSGGIQLK